MIVVWRLTERCNLACAFCAYDRRLMGARFDAAEGAVMHLGRVLGHYKRQTGEPVLLSWLGGEPFLWSPMLELSASLCRDEGINISATTNGTFLHRTNVREAILQTFSELTISVDGFAELHDKLRGWPGGWQRLRSSINQLAERKVQRGKALKLRINIVLMHENLPSFPALCETLVHWGIDEVTFNQLGGRDRPEFFQTHRLDEADVDLLRNTLPALSVKLAAAGVRLCASERYLGRFDASAKFRALPVEDCKAGEDFLFVDEQHRIAPCSFTAGAYGVPVTSIQTVDDLLQLPAVFATRRTHALASACSDCPSTRVFAKFAA